TGIRLMRIAYITPYQGSTLVQRRPIARNRSLSNRIKIDLVAQLLQANGHEVEIISDGAVIELGARFYPGFWKPSYLTPRFRFIMSRHCLLDESMVSGLVGRQRAFLRSDIGYVRSIS
ncbi:MAG TPA: hypothetical protein VFQ43_11030, partial [Nitrososphaera sp.]|nr:hypothetical protein [Nitrososphaera sp.]